MTLGIAVFGAVFVSRAGAELAAAGTVTDPHRAATALSAGRGPRLLAALPPDVRTAATDVMHGAFAAGLDRTFAWSAAAALGALVVALLVRPRPRPPAAPRSAPSGGPAVAGAALHARDRQR